LIERYVFRPGCCTVAHNAAPIPDHVTVSGACYFCKAPQQVTVRGDALQRFRDGGFPQDCFPDLPAAQREFLISGICPTCWNDMFPAEDDDDAEGHSEI
jgi:hypothetical protein